MTDQLASALDEPDAVGQLELAGEFPAATQEQWRRLVAKVLGDAVTDATADAPEQLLATTLADDIVVQPLYTSAPGAVGAGYPGEAPFVRGSGAAGHRSGWDVRQHHANPDATLAREQVMADLGGGASSLWLVLGDGGIPLESLADVLAETYLDLAPVVLDAGERTEAAAAVLFELAARRQLSPSELRGSLGADPLGLAARTGNDVQLDGAVVLAKQCAAEFPNLRAFVVDALPFHDAGGTDAEELGCSLAAGVRYLRAMQAAGLSGDAAFSQLEFRYAATADQFATIAKLRAARRLWAQVAASCEVAGPAAGQRQHAVTSWPMMTRRDPWNNMLRATLACFAAGVGGADAVTVLPFDAAIGRSEDLARRIARNTHALLVEESNVARVIDPSGGSWYVESLTGELATRAWEWFQTIERSGGLEVGLRSGLIADRIGSSRDARRDSLAHRREAITGVSEFPPAREVVLDRPGFEAPAPSGGLPKIRWAQWHEELRDRSDAHTAATGAVPVVALLHVGTARQAAVMADEVRSALAPAGIETSEIRLEEVDAHHAVVGVCIAADAEPDDVSAAAEALRAAGVGYLIVAAASGAPTVADADDQVTEGMDALAFQTRTLDALGVA